MVPAFEKLLIQPQDHMYTVPHSQDPVHIFKYSWKTIVLIIIININIIIIIIKAKKPLSKH